MSTVSAYPVGLLGRPWDAADIATWRERHPHQRSYQVDVIAGIDALSDHFERVDYGRIKYADDFLTLSAVRNRHFNPHSPIGAMLCSHPCRTSPAR